MPSDTTAYNPYIHGTNSSALAALVAVNHQLMPVMSMLQYHQRAPLTGEIVKGGFESMGGALISETVAGAISFGRVQAEKHQYGNGYTLECVIHDYTQFVPLIAEKCIEAFQEQFNNLFKRKFDNFHLFLIHYARARELNPLQGNLLSEEQFQQIEAEFEGVLKYFQLVEIVLGGYVIPNQSKLDSYSKDSNKTSYQALDQLFDDDILKGKLHDISAQELSAILKQPSKENIKGLLAKLGIPAQLFNLNLKKSPKESEVYAGHNDPFDLYRFFSYSQYSLAHCMKQMYSLDSHISTAPFTAFRKRCSKQREIIQERYEIFKKIREAHYSSEPKAPVFSKDFPVIFVTESGHIEPNGHEYRSRFPLKLGVNIHLIATETEEDRQEVEGYLINTCKISNVQVVLIETLKDPEFHPNIREIAPDIVALEQSQIRGKKAANSLKVTTQEPKVDPEIIDSTAGKPINTPKQVPNPVPSSNPNYNMMMLSGVIAVLGIAAVALAFTVLNAATLGILGIAVAAAGTIAFAGGLISLSFFAYQNQSISQKVNEESLEASLV